LHMVGAQFHSSLLWSRAPPRPIASLRRAVGVRVGVEERDRPARVGRERAADAVGPAVLRDDADRARRAGIFAGVLRAERRCSERHLVERRGRAAAARCREQDEQTSALHLSLTESLNLTYLTVLSFGGAADSRVMMPVP